MAPRKSTIINTKLAGVSQANPDGTERQDLIKDLIMGEMVLLFETMGMSMTTTRLRYRRSRAKSSAGCHGRKLPK